MFQHLIYVSFSFYNVSTDVRCILLLYVCRMILHCSCMFIFTYFSMFCLDFFFSSFLLEKKGRGKGRMNKTVSKFCSISLDVCRFVQFICIQKSTSNGKQQEVEKHTDTRIHPALWKTQRDESRFLSRRAMYFILNAHLPWSFKNLD